MRCKSCTDSKTPGSLSAAITWSRISIRAHTSDNPLHHSQHTKGVSMAAKKEKDKSKTAGFLKMLGDPSAPVEQRFLMLTMLGHDDSDDAKDMRAAVLDAITKDQGD